MTRIAIVVLVALLLLALGLRSLLMVYPTGVPNGKSVRIGDNVVTMIIRREPFMATFHRDPGLDTYTIGLLIQSVRDSSVREFVTIEKGQQAVDTPLMDIVAVDGNVLWYRAEGMGAYDIARRAFVAFTPDPINRYDIPAKKFSLAELATDERGILAMLIAGGQPTPSTWLGVLNAREAEVVWGPGSSVAVGMPVEWSREPRHFYLTSIGRDSDGDAVIKRLELIGSDSMLNGAFVRSTRYGEVLRLDGGGGGGGFLLLYDTMWNKAGSIIAARVDAAGKIVWSFDTGLGELKVILPDAALPALIGETSRHPDKLSEPKLLVIDAATGQVTSRSLWLKR